MPHLSRRLYFALESTSTPSIIGSERRPQPEQAGDAERGKTAHLRVPLVQEVLDSGRQVHRLDEGVAVQEAIGAAEVHARVAAVVDASAERVRRLPLLGDDVHLTEEREAFERLPGEADVPAVGRLARN